MLRFRNLLPLATAALAMGAVLGASSPACADISLEFANTTNSTINFNPADPPGGFKGSFTFQFMGMNAPVAGNPVFQITSPTSTANGFTGDITGQYNIGAITTSGPLQTATVTNSASGMHQFIIYDGATPFKADVAWIDIFTLGTTGGLNAGGTVNLVNISYAGSNPDIEALASGNNQTATLSFTFIPARSLQVLTTSGGSTSFSGTVSATPEPGTVVMALSAVPCLLVGRLVRRRKAREVAVS